MNSASKIEKEISSDSTTRLAFNGLGEVYSSYRALSADEFSRKKFLDRPKVNFPPRISAKISRSIDSDNEELANQFLASYYFLLRRSWHGTSIDSRQRPRNINNSTTYASLRYTVSFSPPSPSPHLIL